MAIFGSARIQEGEKIFQDVFDFARALAGQGFDVVTGGDPGLMLGYEVEKPSVWFQEFDFLVQLSLIYPHFCHGSSILF